MRQSARLARPVTFTALAVLACSVPLLTACNGSPAESDEEVARPAKIHTVLPPGSERARVFPGRVQASQRVPLSFRVGGPVVEFHVDKGARVQKGALLARIDPRDYEVNVANLASQLAAARAQELQAREEFKRVRGLYEHDNVSKSEFDRARAAIEVAQARVKAAEQALKAARLALSDTRLEAPYAGIVADRLVDAHQTVSAGTPVLLFQDVTGLEVVIDVAEKDMTELTRKASRRIVVRFDAVADGAYPAQVKEFATEPDPFTQTFPVTLRLTREPADKLLPGMTASVSWYTDIARDQRAPLVVPLASVLTGETGEPFVWRVDPGSMRTRRAPVQTGSLTSEGMQILSGLAPGDQVLAAGAHAATEGLLVEPLER